MLLLLLLLSGVVGGCGGHLRSLNYNSARREQGREDKRSVLPVTFCHAGLGSLSHEPEPWE